MELFSAQPTILSGAWSDKIVTHPTQERSGIVFLNPLPLAVSRFGVWAVFTIAFLFEVQRTRRCSFRQ